MRSSANKAVVALLLVSWGALAQEKEKPNPPPPRLELPADSTRAIAPEKKDASERGSDKLQLPDVLIYGRDSDLRSTGQKITISPEQLGPEPPSSREAPPDSAAILRGDKAHLQEAGTSARNRFRGRLALGSFGQVESNAQLRLGPLERGPDRKFELATDFEFNRANGQFPNSDFREWRLDLGGQYDWGGASSAALKLGGGRRQYGFHVAANPDLDADVGSFTSDAQVSFPAGQSAKVVLGGRLHWHDYEYVDADSSSDSRVDERLLLWRAAFEKRFRGFSLEAGAESLSDALNVPADSTAGNRLSQLSVSLRFPIGRAVTMTAGSRVTWARSEEGGRKRRWGPVLRAVSVPHPRLALSAEFSNGWRLTPLSNRWLENYFIDATSRQLPEDVAANLVFTVDYRLVRGWMVQLQYSRVEVRQFSYFERSAGTGLLALRQLDKVTLSDLTIGLQMKVGEQLQLSSALHFLDDDVQSAGVPIFADVPYRGDVWLPAKLEYTPSPRTRVSAEARLVGSRRTALLSRSALEGYVELRVRGEWKALSPASLFVEARNLLDDAYERWLGYREMGANVVVGMIAAW